MLKVYVIFGTRNVVNLSSKIEIIYFWLRSNSDY